MKIAVTGASGFIGTHVLRALRSTGAEVTAITRDPKRLSHADGINIVTLDMARPTKVPFDAMGRPDVLIHLAWGGLPNYESDTHLNLELPLQKAFLESCVASGLKRLFVAGTCLEYGMRSGELSEGLDAMPVTAYGAAKNTLRSDLGRLRENHDFELTWFRVFYLYGQRQAKTSLYSQLQAAISSGSSTFSMSPGDQVRDFLPVREAARCIVTLAMANTPGCLVNLCSGQPITVLEMVREWMRERGATLELNLGAHPYPSFEPHSFWGTREKLDRLLGEAR